MTKCPCKDCQKRHFNCHSLCRDYQGWKKEHAEMMEKKPASESFTFSDSNKRKYWKHITRTKHRNI